MTKPDPARESVRSYQKRRRLSTSAWAYGKMSRELFHAECRKRQT